MRDTFAEFMTKRNALFDENGVLKLKEGETQE
jgi:hypothetical protein